MFIHNEYGWYESGYWFTLISNHGIHWFESLLINVFLDVKFHQNVKNKIT